MNPNQNPIEELAITLRSDAPGGLHYLLVNKLSIALAACDGLLLLAHRFMQHSLPAYTTRRKQFILKNHVTGFLSAALHHVCGLKHVNPFFNLQSISV